MSRLGPDAVARMKRNGIRGRSINFTVVPDFTSLHPGYEERKRKRNAVRRCSVTTAAFGLRHAPYGCARLPAFHRGSYQRESSSLRRSSGQASWIRSPKAADVPPAPYPLAASTSHAGHSAGRLMPEPPENGSDEPPSAGTTLAPPAAVTRLASFTKSEI